MPGPVEVYRRTKKPRDLFWNRFVCRPVAAVVVAAIAGTRATPNQMTFVAFALALGSAAAIVGAPGYWGLLVAIVLYEISYVFDCVDGMLARLRGTASPTGHLLDFLMDEIKAFVILASVAVRLWRDSGSALYLVVGLGGLVVLAAGISTTTFLRRPEIVGDRDTIEAPSVDAPEAKRSLVAGAVRIAEGVGRFFIHYPSYILYTAIAGRLDVYLFLYVGANALHAARALASVAWRFGRT